MTSSSPAWILLIHQVPPKPDYLRVKFRRRLRRIGAAAIKDSVYVLPNNEESLEDFLWLAQEIRSDGGEAVVVEASFVAGLTDEEVRMKFDEPGRPGTRVEPPSPGGPRARTWVTRVGVKVDRIASAWLILRFIDPEARFKFVPSRGYRPLGGELRFDMFEAEYSHEGDRCTFEVLLQRFDLAGDPALRAIGEVVHDIDCKDEKFGRSETAGVEAFIRALVASCPEDQDRVERGRVIFGDLYAAFQGGGTSTDGGD
jgi:hypothetical protein